MERHDGKRAVLIAVLSSLAMNAVLDAFSDAHVVTRWSVAFLTMIVVTAALMSPSRRRSSEEES